MGRGKQIHVASAMHQLMRPATPDAKYLEALFLMDYWFFRSQKSAVAAKHRMVYNTQVSVKMYLVPCLFCSRWRRVTKNGTKAR